MAQLDNRPLLGTLDRNLFVEPPLMRRLSGAVDRRLNTLILGGFGAGKTSLLRRLDADTKSPLPRVYVDIAPAADAREALTLVAEALGISGATQVWSDELHARFRPPTPSSSPLLRLVRRLKEARPSLILMDSPPGNGESHAIFGRLRDELWQLDHQWVVAASSNLRDELTRPPASAFFDVQLELEPLSHALQRELLMRRLTDEDVDVDTLVGKTDGLPRSLVGLAREVVLAGGSPDDVLKQRDRVRKRLEQLPASALAITDYLGSHGAVAGSDPGLLGALGVSAQRARQVLHELENAGIVRSFVEQQGQRQGRPRKLYELVDEAR